MPYRGLGSGIIRALQEEPNIKFINEPVGMQFISVINRIADEGVNEGEGIKNKFSCKPYIINNKPNIVINITNLFINLMLLLFNQLKLTTLQRLI